MHSRVFQLETSPRKFEIVDREKEWSEEFEDDNLDWLNEYTLEKNNFPDPNWVDWWKDSEDTPEEDFKWFIGNLPRGCFKANKKNLSITLVKKPITYAKNYFAKVRKESRKLNLEDYLNNNCSTWSLERLVRNNGHNFLVYSNEDGYPIYLHEWLMGLAKHGEVGTTYYVGGILDYHW